MLFIFLCVIFNNFFTIPTVIENAKLKLATPTGATMTVADDTIETLPIVAYKKIKDS